MTQKTKIFISCGQRDDSREVKVAKKIVNALEKLGYDTFLAKEVQNLGALTGVIYKELELAEYFLFIDFKREEVLNTEDGSRKNRGSLFSHQELAIASYLEKECLVFREQNMALEGIQQFIISNPLEFSSDSELLNKVSEEVKARWQTGWKNSIEIVMADPIYQDAYHLGIKKNTRWYHVAVKNNHHSKHAKNCYAYIADIHCGPTPHQKLRNAEVHWAGYETPAMTILPKDKREIDVFWFHLDSESKHLYFNSFATSTYYQPWPIDPKTTTGYYSFRIRVVSDNFPMEEASFKLTYTGYPDTVIFEQMILT